MKRANCLLALVGLLFSVAAVANENSSLRISKLTQGLARVVSQSNGHIYSEGTTFRIATNGQCIEVGKSAPCMYFAIAFDYEAPSEITNLSCTTKSSDPVDIVDVNKVHGTDLMEHTNRIVLKGKSGKAFWPAYLITEDKRDAIRIATVCSFEGKEVLQVNFSFY